MMDRAQLVEKLVSTLHLDFRERHALETSSLRSSEVIDAVKRLLVENGRFPSHGKSWHPGEVVLEGHYLELLTNGSVRLIWQRSDPLRPVQLAEQHQTDFEDVDRAVEVFVEKEWPRGIDGIGIVPG